jgi:hypothetical protein
MASQTMVLEFGDRQDIAMRLALTGTVEGALSAIAPVVGGLIAVGFSLTPVFALSILFELGAFFILLMRVNEPRMR